MRLWRPGIVRSKFITSLVNRTPTYRCYPILVLVCSSVVDVLGVLLLLTRLVVLCPLLLASCDFSGSCRESVVHRSKTLDPQIWSLCGFTVGVEANSWRLLV